MIPINTTFVVSASASSCPSDGTSNAFGWIQLHVCFDRAGNFVAGIETRHIVFTHSANGNYEKIMQEVAATWPHGNFSQVVAGHEIYLDDPDAVVAIMERLLSSQ
jgi:hypothetical protein